MLRRLAPLCLGVCVLAPSAVSAEPEVVISEFMAINSGTVFDEDGESSDWLELANQTFDSISLDGWFLTDDDDDLEKWRIPNVVLDGGGRVVIFCSGKDRSVPGSELHTNYRLGGDGEFLALVGPDGETIEHSYSPDYPRQRPDVSYGIGIDRIIDTVVSARADARVLIPRNDALGTSWTGGNEPFNDASWTIGQLGVGYLSSQPGFSVRVIYGLGGVTHISNAEEIARDPSPGGDVHSELAPIINYYNTGGRGRFTNDVTFPGATIGEDRNGYVLEARASVTIPQAGAWSFGCNSDDGFSLEIDGHGESFRMEFPQPRGPGDTIRTFNFPAPGNYDLYLVFYENGGGSCVELFAQRGTHSSFNAGFDLVGDTASGGLEVRTDVGAVGSLSGYRSLIGTDVQDELRGEGSSAYARVPFDVADRTAYESLTLRVKYDDAFVAYLNGAEIARSNLAGAPRHDSLANSDRSNAQALSWHEIDVTNHIGLLANGANLLALHGINDATDSDDFLITAELAEITVTSMASGYFTEPTPGTENVDVFLDFVADTSFSRNRGFYDAPIDVTIASATEGAQIMYTLDGSAPTLTNGALYESPIAISRTTTLRAAAFFEDLIPTNVDTHTYIFVDQVREQTGAGFPGAWGSRTADYEVDPEVTGNPAYSATFRDDLLSIPSMSIVMDLDDLFGSRGIYSNPGGSGQSWERPSSVELILPDGVEIPGGGRGFQENCAMRMHGGHGRNSSIPKHNFRMLFKGAYGATKLNYPLFAASPRLLGQGATDQFDTLILRAGGNNSWVWNISGQNRQAQYLRDQFIRDSLNAMGSPAPHGTFVHLYVNGLYWGLYNLVERPSAPFCEAYFGGAKDDWDVLNSGEAVDGSRDAWNELYGIVAGGLSTPEAYAAIQEYVDVPNLIDYMIANIYGSNGDWDGHNWYSGRHRVPGAGYKFFSWDAERTLEGLGSNRTGINNNDKPSGIYGALRANEEFRVLFGDTLHRHFFNFGAMSPDATIARYRYLSDFTYGAIVGESARWGDTWREQPYTRDVEWITERDRLLNSYLPQRTDVVLGQFRGANLYPRVEAPRFNQHGGRIESGFGLIVTGSEGTIYYTLDGTDPRLEGGALNPVAEIAGEIEGTALIDGNSLVRVHVPTDDTLGTDWIDPDFDDSTWTEGTNGVGYDYGDLVNVDVRAQMSGTNATCYVRIPFHVEDPAAVSLLQLRMQYEDGFVCYLNGERVAARNAPGALTWNSNASGNHSDNSAVVFQSIELADGVQNLLREDDNVLAFHGLNVSTGSSDFLLVADLSSIVSTGQGIVLDRTTTVKSRTLLDGDWSALVEAKFTIDATLPLRITEIMYNPATPEEGSQWSASDFEYIELKNVGAEVISLERVRFLVGIEVDFSDSAITSLAPGDHVVLVNNLSAFESLYDTNGMLIAGEYDGQLANDGESLGLVDAVDDVIHFFRYEDEWHPTTDGGGHSLVIVDELAPSDNWALAESWEPSEHPDGSPGSDTGEVNPAGRQRRGDSNQDGVHDVSDAVHFLRRLFGAEAIPLPCEGVALDDGANLAVLDLNGDSGVDVSDAIYYLAYLFQAGPGPVGGTACVRVSGCPHACTP